MFTTPVEIICLASKSVTLDIGKKTRRRCGTSTNKPIILGGLLLCRKWTTVSRTLPS
jgi:hypothetical protein